MRPAANAREADPRRPRRRPVEYGQDRVRARRRSAASARRRRLRATSPPSGPARQLLARAVHVGRARSRPEASPAGAPREAPELFPPDEESFGHLRRTSIPNAAERPRARRCPSERPHAVKPLRAARHGARARPEDAHGRPPRPRPAVCSAAAITVRRISCSESAFSTMSLPRSFVDGAVARRIRLWMRANRLRPGRAFRAANPRAAEARRSSPAGRPDGCRETDDPFEISSSCCFSSSDDGRRSATGARRRAATGLFPPRRAASRLPCGFFFFLEESSSKGPRRSRRPR